MNQARRTTKAQRGGRLRQAAIEALRGGAIGTWRPPRGGRGPKASNRIKAHTLGRRRGRRLRRARALKTGAREGASRSESDKPTRGLGGTKARGRRKTGTRSSGRRHRRPSNSSSRG